MGLPTFSVLLANYNQESYLLKAVENILKQSLRPDEIIIVDDCSTDNSVETIQKILKEEPWIKFIQNEKNLGTVQTFNRLINAATCDYFHAIGPDDKILPGFYEKSLDLLGQYPQSGLCSSIVQCQDIHGKNLQLIPGPPDMPEKECFLTPEQFLDMYNKKGSWYCGTSAIWRREPYLEFGAHSPQTLGSLLDTVKFFQLAIKYGVCFIPEVLHTWTLTSTGFSAGARLNPDLALNLIEKAEEVMASQKWGVFPTTFIKEFKRRGLVSVANISLQKCHFETMQALEYNEKNRPGISWWDRLFLSLLKSFYKIQYFFTMLHFNFNLPRIFEKWKWKIFNSKNSLKNK
ncbi:MAG: glycosyltransferase family 2 protein [Nitrospinota bacterium]